MELDRTGSYSNRMQARDGKMFLRLAAHEEALLVKMAAHERMELATYVRCAALTFAADARERAGLEPAGVRRGVEIDARQLPLPITVPSVPLARALELDAMAAKRRKAVAAEAPARRKGMTAGQALAAVRRKVKKPTPKKLPKKKRARGSK